MAGRSAAREPVVRKRATSPRTVVRRFLRDLHVMHVALALAGTGDLHELRPRAHVFAGGAADVANRPEQAADERVTHVDQRAAVRNGVFVAVGHAPGGREAVRGETV